MVGGKQYSLIDGTDGKMRDSEGSRLALHKDELHPLVNHVLD